MIRREGGYILVAVLGTLLVLAGLVASASLVAQSALRGGRADEGAAQRDALARSGLEIAAYRVFMRHASFADVNGQVLRLPGGTATPNFSDEAARIDVNGADPIVLLGALRAAGLDEGTASALVSRTVSLRDVGRSADDDLKAPDALAKSSAAAPEPPAPVVAAGTGAPRGSFRTVADFIVFARIDRDAATSLFPLLTASNPDGKVDVLTASRRVLMTLPNMSDALADTLLADRKDAKMAVERAKAALAAQARFIKFDPGPCYGVTIEARDRFGRSLTRHGIIAASSRPATPFRTLAWE